MLLRQVKKQLYSNVYNYASVCQILFFDYYMKKYLKKQIKFRTVNRLENPELVELNNIRREEYNYCKQVINNCKNIIIKELGQLNMHVYKLSKKNYAIDLYLYKHEFDLIEDTALYLRNRLELRHQFNDELNKILKDSVEFSFDLRKGFGVSDTTAKTKIQEHLFSRMPIFAFSVTGLLLLKIMEMLIEKQTEYLMLKIVILAFVYVSSLYLIYLRVFQSVKAESKKAASEQYKKSKRRLYENFVKSLPNQNDNLINNDVIKQTILQYVNDKKIENIL